jgi:hypothetical protein
METYSEQKYFLVLLFAPSLSLSLLAIAVDVLIVRTNGDATMDYVSTQN